MFRAGILFVIANLFCLPALADQNLCGQIFIKDTQLSINENERTLICGSNKSSEAWRDVPVQEAQLHLSVLLSNRGYLSPTFERHKDRLDVWAGKIRTISHLNVEGGDGVLRPWKKRKIRGYPLTPAKLDEVTQWADKELKSQGYACETSKITAQAWDGSLNLEVTPGPQKIVGGITREGLAGLDPASMQRYEAFQAGQIYDVRKTQISTDRMLADGLVQSAYYSAKCKNPGPVDLVLHSSLGRPRLLRFGIGASTEEYVFGDATIRNVRLDNHASSFTANLHASPRIQSAEASSQLFWIPNSTRTYFGPRFKVSHDIETAYEVAQAKLGADLARAWDTNANRFQATAGPSLNYVRTYRGDGPSEASYVSWQATAAITNHAYEENEALQWGGWVANFGYQGQREGLGSAISVDRYDFSAKKLWNIGAFSPPLFVLGVRVEGTAVLANQLTQGQGRNFVPIEYRIFYGGDQNLRGFSRQALNDGGLGYLTSIYVGSELRLVEVLPYHIEPFLLWDGAELGDRKLTLDKALFTSYGLGVRWGSPFGTIRGSFARGDILNKDQFSQAYQEEWVAFFSFGREF
jgi:translocation and assembly module TamA